MDLSRSRLIESVIKRHFTSWWRYAFSRTGGPEDSSPLEIMRDAEGADRRKQLLDAVRQECARLPEQMRETLLLFVLHDPPLTLRELAGRQGVAVSTAYAQIQRGLERLAKALTRGSRRR